jgi:flagellar basal body-associated protein FliL
MSFNEPLDEKEVIPENTQQKKHCITIIIIVSLILFIGIIGVSILLFFLNRKDDKKNEIE